MQTTTLISVTADGLAIPNSRRQFVPVKTGEQEISDFATALEEALKELEEAFKEKKGVDKKLQVLQQDLNDRGLWGQIKNTFSGKTDKELASMVEGVVKSLGLTQSVVRVMLKVQTQKSRLLYAFNDAIVGKIARIQGDTHTLDSNQKQATLVFLGELQDQLYEQIRQQELVDSHESRLDDQERWQKDKDIRDASLTSQVSLFQSENADLKQQIEILEPKLDTLKTRVDLHESSKAALEHEINILVPKLESLRKYVDDQEFRLRDYEQWRKDKDDKEAVLVNQLSQFESEKATMKQQIEFLASKLATFEEIENKSRLPKAIFIRNLLPVTAVVLGCVALFLVL